MTTSSKHTLLSVKTRTRRATIELELEDDLSLIASLKVDIDNGDIHPLSPIDGLIDQRRERFEWQTPILDPGEHVATFVATDRQGNSTVNKAVFTVDK